MFIWDIVPTRGTCPKGLQDALLMVATWSTQWAMAFSMAKCQAIDIRAMRAIAPLAVSLYGEVVPQVTKLKYLSVCVDS